MTDVLDNCHTCITLNLLVSVILIPDNQPQSLPPLIRMNSHSYHNYPPETYSDTPYFDHEY